MISLAPWRSSGISSRPSQSIRSATVWLKARGTRGAGGAHLELNCSSRTPRRINRTSRNPSVVIKPVLAPRPTSTAFVVIVVPCTMRMTVERKSPSPSPALPASFSRPSNTPLEGSSGVVNVFSTTVLPSACTRTQSVKVPPTSMPIKEPVSSRDIDAKNQSRSCRMGWILASRKIRV